MIRDDHIACNLIASSFRPRSISPEEGILLYPRRKAMSAWADVVSNVLLRFFPSRKQHGTELRLTCVSFPLLNGCNRSELFLSVVYWPETELSEILQEAPETVEMGKFVLETRLYYYQKQLVEICELPATPWSSSDILYLNHTSTVLFCLWLSQLFSSKYRRPMFCKLMIYSFLEQ
jgi:hypothetical protein